MKRFFGCKFLFLILSEAIILLTGGVAFSNSLDSLKMLVAKESNPLKKTDLLHQISLMVSQTDLDKALIEVNAEHNYAVKVNSNQAILQALVLKGRILNDLHLSDSALSCYEKAEKISREINDSSQLARVYNQLGDVYNDNHKLSTALEYYNKSYFINVQLKNNKGLIENLNRISMVYFDQNRFDDAYKKNVEAFGLANEMGDEGLIAGAQASLGNIFYMRNELDSALTCYLKTLPYYEKKGGIRLAGIYANVGDVYVDQKNHGKALAYFNKAMPILEQLGSDGSLAHLYISIGRCYLFNRQYERALPYLEKGEVLAKQAADYEMLAEVYGLTADVYAAQYDYKKAFQFQLKVEAAKDSLNNLTRDDKVLELQTRYETLKHEQENAMLKMENELARGKLDKQQFSIIVLSVASVFIAIMGLMIYRFLRLRSKKLKSEQALNSRLELQNLNIARLNNMLEIRAIRAQMDPHFLFNCMASLQHLITIENVDDAERYIVKFSRLLRMVLENAEQNTVSLDKEIEMLKLYLDLESIRMSENFKYVINVDESLLEENIKVPTLVIQPFAENAIWHGLAEKKENRVLLINIEANDNVLKCTIEDNGIGRKKSSEKSKKKGHESKAVKMIIERLKIIKQQTRVDATGIETVDLYDEHQEPAGTKVIIQLPVIVRA